MHVQVSIEHMCFFLVKFTLKLNLWVNGVTNGSIPGGPPMLDLIGCAVVSTAMRHHAQSVIHVYIELALQRTLCLCNQPTRADAISTQCWLAHTNTHGTWHSGDRGCQSHTSVRSIPGGSNSYMCWHLMFQMELISTKPACPHRTVCSLGFSRFRGGLREVRADRGEWQHRGGPASEPLR